MRWGFIGYGRIARKFEENLAFTDHQIIAIASRSAYKSVQLPIKGYSTYEEIYQDPEIEIVYINTTHNTHCEHAIAALKAGKHVLCEKPMAISPDEVGKMIATARAEKRFLMEALWTRYLPAYQKVISMINSGVIGSVQNISAHFGFKMNPDDPKERLINPDLAAGAVWDVGIYPLSLIQDIYGDDPKSIQVAANLSKLKIENRCLVQLTYPEGRMAQLSCAVDLSTPNHAFISGESGHILMYDFWKCEKFTLTNSLGSQDFHLPYVSTGLYHEAIACANITGNGLVESKVISWEHSLQLSRIMSDIISQARAT